MTTNDQILDRLAEIENKLDRLLGSSVNAEPTLAESRLEMKAIVHRSKVVGLKQALEEFGRAPKDGRKRVGRK